MDNAVWQQLADLLDCESADSLTEADALTRAAEAIREMIAEDDG